MNEILRELVEYCKKDYHSGALLLTGGWGCGKTYLIENILREEVKNTHILIRVSLFGIDSVNELNRLIKNKWLYRYLIEHNIINEPDEVFISKTIQFIKIFNKFIPKNYKWIFTASSSTSNVSDLLEIKKLIKDKEVIFVFDDLERAHIVMDQLLGCINEICENKNIKVILIANEDMVDEKDYYCEFKEKLVERTIYYDIKSFADQIKNIIVELINEENDLDYKNLLKENINDITNLFINASDIKMHKDEKCIVVRNLRNIRSLKCGVRDFEKVFQKINNIGFQENDHWLFDFLCFFLFTRAINLKNGEYGTILEEKYIREKYIGYYDGRYITKSIKDWIMYGLWNTNAITIELEEKLKQMSLETPEERVQRIDLLSMEDDDLSCFPVLLEKAYNGQIDLDDYVNLIMNSYLSRDCDIPIPSINWDQIYKGIQIKINQSKKNNTQFHETRAYVRKVINKENKDYYTDEEWKAYEMINDFENKRYMYDNEKFYVELLAKESKDAFQKLNGLKFELFNNDMCNATYKSFIILRNIDKGGFISNFINMWDQQIESLQFDSYDSINVFVNLKNMLEEYLEDSKREKNVICSYHTKRFVEKVNGLIAKCRESSKLGA